jgi:Recombination endonuclease VII
MVRVIRMRNGTVGKVGDQYSAYYRSDDGECHGCGRHGPRVVDHCHVHNTIRGELCSSCNAGGMRAMVFAKYAKRCKECATLLASLANHVVSLGNQVVSFDR